MDKAGAVHAADLKRRDALTRMRKDDKGKERIAVELVVDGRTLREKDEAAIKSTFVGAVKTAGRESRALVGSYRGFEIYALRYYPKSQAEGFHFALKGSGDQEFLPENLTYAYDDTISISGWFQRMDNFLDKGLEQSFQTYKGNVEREIAELATIRSALGQEFGQKDELTLTRENHAAVMRELKRMQDEPAYVSEWEPKTLAADTEQGQGDARETDKTAAIPIMDDGALAVEQDARERVQIPGMPPEGVFTSLGMRSTGSGRWVMPDGTVSVRHSGVDTFSIDFIEDGKWVNGQTARSLEAAADLNYGKQ